jgi:hypothetical protein
MSIVVASDYSRNASIAVPAICRERILAFEAPHAEISGRVAV